MAENYGLNFRVLVLKTINTAISNASSTAKDVSNNSEFIIDSGGFLTDSLTGRTLTDSATGEIIYSQ